MPYLRGQKRIQGPGFRSGAFGQLPYNPIDDGVTCWINGQEGIVPGIGSGISQWSDLSGNDYHYIQNTGADQPLTGTRQINGLNAIEFNGSEFMQITSGYQPGSNNSMIFSVVDLDLATNNRIINNEQSGGTKHGIMIRGGVCQYLHSNIFDPVSSAAVSLGVGLYSGYRDGITCGVGVNGNYTTDSVGANAPSVNTWFLGARSILTEYFDGAIAEILVFLDYDEDIGNRVTNYLNVKYNLGIAFPYTFPLILS